jgi:hypothetical protein
LWDDADSGVGTLDDGDARGGAGGANADPVLNGRPAVPLPNAAVVTAKDEGRECDDGGVTALTSEMSAR